MRFAITSAQVTVIACSGIDRLLGFRDDNFLNGNVSLRDRFHGDDADYADEIFSPKRCESTTRTLRLRHTDGHILIVQAQFKKSSSPTVALQLDLLLRDVKTLQRTMKEATSMVNFRAMMENTDDYIYFKDRNHVFTGASQTLVALCAPVRHWTDFLGKTDYDVFPEEYADIYYRLEKQVFQGVAVAHEVQETLNTDGKKGWVDNRKYPILDERGTVIGLYGIARDISELKAREAELEQHRNKLESTVAERTRELHDAAERMTTLLDTASDGVHVLDEDGYIVEFSRSFARMLGYQPEELPGMHVSKWDAGQEPEGLVDTIRKLTREATTFETIHRRKDGSTFEVEISAKGVTLQDRRYLYASSRDISQRKSSEKALRQSEQRFQDFSRSTADWFWEMDSNLRFSYISENYENSYGLNPERILGKTRPEFLSLDNLNHPALLSNHVEMLEQHLPFRDFEYRARNDDGQITWFSISGIPTFSEDGAFSGYRGIGRNVTDRKNAEVKLQLAASVFNYAHEGIMITDTKGSIIDVNDAFCRVTGYGRDQILGMNPRFLKSGRHGKEFFAAMWRGLVEYGHWQSEVWNRKKDGEEFVVQQTVSVVNDAQGEPMHYVSLFSDITTLKAHERQLEDIAHYDALTRLPNRILLADRLSHAIAQAKRHRVQLAVAYLDLDGFKAVNDQYGHSVGDQLLVTVANRMRGALRDNDTFARLGGDEFVAVITDLTKVGDCTRSLSGLLAAAAQPVHVGEMELRVSASIGVTFYPQKVEVDADQLLRQADQAMYQAKLAGRSRYHFFDVELDHSVHGHREDVDQIQQALDNDQFVLYYQPIVNMRSGQVRGAEALIRWQHPSRGLLLPAQFLPVIEERPLASDLGAWVIDSALTQVEAWESEGLSLQVSVNVAAYHLQQPDFVERLRLLLLAHPQVSPSQLKLEVLETSALADIGQVSKVIEACRDLGVNFALDDFGTGYSSLTYLRRLPASDLKIDQSFVRGMLDDPDDLAIINGILGLATAFRRKVVAEGVETTEHVELLLQLGCDLAQGYGIARPMPAKDLPQWAQKWRPDPSWAELTITSRDDLPLLFAGAEHRAWIRDTEAWIRAERVTPPSITAQNCRFGIWLDAENLGGRSKLPAARDIESTHQQLHDLINDLCNLHARGHSHEAIGKLERLYTLRDSLLAQLKALTRERRIVNYVKLVWQSSYECGDATIDEQHRALFGQVNNLLAAILSTRPQAEVSTLLEALIRDIIEHFRDEEAIYVSSGYPGAAEHTTIHRDLLERAGSLAGRYNAGALNVGEVFQFLAHDVVARHMLVTDREYFAYLGAHNAST